MNTRLSDLQEILQAGRDKELSARILFDNDRYADSTSRCYYAVFHGLTAILMTKELVFSSHGQLIGAFDREFIKTGIFPESFSKTIQQLYDLRQKGDYSFDPGIDRDTASETLRNTGIILESIEMYIREHQ